MLLRWLKRSAWLVLLLVLIVAPARLARGPASVQAADESRNSVPFKDLSPVAGVVATMSALLLGAFWLRRQRLN